MASPTLWTWVWVNSGRWWWTGRPGVLWFMGSQIVRHDWVTELNWTHHLHIRAYWAKFPVFFLFLKDFYVLVFFSDIWDSSTISFFKTISFCMCMWVVCLYMSLCVAVFNIKDCTVLIYMLNILNDFGFKKSFFMLYLNVKYFVIALSLCLSSLITPLHRSLLRVFSLFLSFYLWHDCDIIQGFFLILQDLSTGRRRRAQRGWEMKCI